MSLENKRHYRLNLIVNRAKNGLILFSIRNLLMRIGINIGPYYWVREGFYPIQEPIIKLNPDECKVAYLDLKDMEEIRKTRTSFGSDFTSSLKNGQKCLGLKYNGEIAAFMFIQFNGFIFQQRTFSFMKNEAYLLNMYTYNNFRGKNLAPYLRYHSYELLKKDGIDTVYSITMYFNKSAIKFKKKLKAKNNKLYLYITLFKKYTWNFVLKNYGL